MNRLPLSIVLIFVFGNINAQLILNADGPGGMDTYELITSKLAPGNNPIEVPDCGHTDFDDHIDELFDAELNTNVFRFHIHTSEDDDRCINTDRQRNEIKTYAPSPDSLLGVEGEMVEYKWKFKLDAGFQSSPKFTHIHQLKAVGGSESAMPLITLTTRLGSPDQLELNYAETTTQTTLHEVDLTPFKGTWCEAIETVTYGESGVYAIIITKVSDGSTLFTYANNNIRMWKTDADFIRPKWGIYRSLDFPDDLRDEEVLFANFSIEEITGPLPVELISFDGKATEDHIILNWKTASEQNNRGFEIQKSNDGINWEAIVFIPGKEIVLPLNQYNHIDTNPFSGFNYYRLKQIDLNENFEYTDKTIVYFERLNSSIAIYPNPTTGIITISGMDKNLFFEVFNMEGKKMLEGYTTNNQIDLSPFSKGAYSISIHTTNGIVVRRLLKK